jgi:hypothetical protein
MKLAVSRRAFNKTFGALGSGAAAYFSGLFRDVVYAQTADANLRYVQLYTPNGCAPAFWRPRAPGGGPAATTGWTVDYDPDSSLGPLEKYKDTMVVVEGLDFASLYKAGVPNYTTHTGGGIGPFTGRPGRPVAGQNAPKATGPSLDMYLADKLRVKPFLFKVNGYSGSASGQSYDAAGEPVPNLYELKDAYRDWFANLVAPGAATDDTLIKARKNLQIVQMGYLKNEIGVLKRNLAGPERQKLDAHLDALNLMEQRITAVKPVTCSQPAAPTSASSSDIVAKHKAQWEMTAQIFACNLTRVAALRMELSNAAGFINMGGTTNGHDTAHLYRPGNEQSARNLSKWHRWTAQQVAYFLDLLKAIPEAGKTVYDHTVLLWSNELGDPAQHESTNVPYVVVGGGGTFPKGRYLSFDNTPGYRGKPDANTRLLTSVANAFGANTPNFGDPDFPGELPGFLG